MLNYNTQLQQNNQELEQINSQINNLPEIPNTTDATVSPEDIMYGETGIVNGEKITGTIQRTSDELYGRETPYIKLMKDGIEVNEINLTKEKPSETFTIDTNSDGNIEVENKNIDLTSLSISEKTLTLNSNKKSGKGSLEISIEKTGNFLKRIKQISYVCTFAREITFTVEGSSYIAEEGMTWEQWVNSKYNINSFFEIYGNNINDKNQSIIKYNDDIPPRATPVNKNDLIKENEKYIASPI